MLMNNIVFAHGIDKKGIRFTVAMRATVRDRESPVSTTRFDIGLAACSPEDQFVKKTGIEKASYFLTEAPISFINLEIIDNKKKVIQYLHDFVRGRSKDSVLKFIDKKRGYPTKIGKEPIRKHTKKL